MKIVLRISAVALIAAGVISANTSRPVHAASKTVAMNSAIPVPVCPPSDPHGCGIDQLDQ